MSVYIDELTNLSDRGKEFEEFKTKLLSSGQTNEFTPDDLYNRLYKNKQFVDKYGMDLFKQIESPEERDVIFRDDVLRQELSRYANDPNLPIIQSMAPESQIELFKHNYLTPEERSAKGLSGDLNEAQKSFLDAVAKEESAGRAGWGAVQGAGVGAGVGTVLAAFTAGISIPAATGIGAAVGGIKGYTELLWDRYVHPENLEASVNEQNENLLNMVFERDVEKKLNDETVSSESSITQESIRSQLIDGSMTYDQLDSIFKSLVGASEETENGTVYTSNYYQAFKDSILADLDEDTKIKIVSDYLAMKENHPEIADKALDQVFQNIVADRQSVGEHLVNILRRNAIGLGNDFAQIPTTAIAAGLDLFADDETLQNFIDNGMIGDLDMSYVSGAYWNKAAKYNTLSKESIEKAERLGGLSEANIVREAGANPYNIWTMAEESLGQIHYLAYYGLMGKAIGGIGNKLGIKDMSTALGKTYKASAVVVPNLSMGAQMGYEAYEGTKETLMEKYNESVMNTLEGLIQPELEKTDWNSELREYKMQHSREGEQILMSDDQLIDMLKQQKVAELSQAFLPYAQEANKDVLNEVNSQAIDAFRMESVMDLMKNSVNVSTFRGWIYNNNQALQRSIRNDRLQGITYKGNTAIAPKKPKLLFLKVAAKETLSEAFDEYLDGVTTGMAEGYNVSQFNDWLLNRENPDTVDATTKMFNALSGMAMGIRNSFNEDNIYEASLGAISPWMPLFQRGSARPGKKWRPFVTNAVYEEYISQLDRHADVETRVGKLNKFLTDNEKKINEIAYLNAANQGVELAKILGDSKALKDAEQHQLVQLASYINSVNDMAGGAETVQQMNETIDRLVNDDYTDEEKQSLGAEFIGQKGNEGLTVQEGYERMRHNAQRLLETTQKIREVEAKIDKHPNSKRFSSGARQHLINLAVQQEDWEKRLTDMSKELGIGDSHSTILGVNDMATQEDASQLVSEIKSQISDMDSYIKNINSEIAKNEKELDSLSKNKKLSVEEKDKKRQDLNTELEGLKQSKAQLQKEKDRLTSMHTTAEKELQNWDDNKEVLQADAIMGMGASKIRYMIDNKSKYNAEQRAQIDEVERRLVSNDPQYSNKLSDIERVASSLETSKRTSAAIQDGPEGYSLLANRLAKAKSKAQARRENTRYRNQVFMSWDSKSADEIMVDASDREDPTLVEEYRKRNPNRADELQGVADVLALQDNLTSLVDKEDTIIANALKKSIRDITKQAKSKDEAIQLLNIAIQDKSLPEATRQDIRNVLDTSKLLDNAADAAFKQEKDEIRRKEDERKRIEAQAAEYDAYVMAEAERRADEEAKKRATTKPETLEDKGQEVAEQVDRIETGREPIEQIDEEVVPLYSPGIESVPNSDDIAEKELDKAEDRGDINDVPSTDLDTTVTTGVAGKGEFVGNNNSRYRVVDGEVKLREDAERVEGKLKAIFDWYDSANIRYQEVIDNELNAISKLDPDVHILKVAPKVNATNDSAMQDVYMLVVEYTDEIANIHKGDDSIISADGKKWLVIGALGGNNTDSDQTKSFRELTKNYNQLDNRFRNFWRNNPSERFHVDEVAHTKISRINPGRLVRVTLDGKKGTQSISSLLEDSDMELRDAKWAIAKGGELKIVGRVPEGSILNETGVAEKSGTVYLLVPAAGGQYIATYIMPSFTDSLNKDSKLKSIINDALTRLASDDHKSRYDALLDLMKYVYLDDNNNILIGTEDNNTITIIQEGVKKPYKLDDPTTSKAAIIDKLLNTRFRVNVRVATLTDKHLLELYDEAGALLTDLQKFGVSGADFNVYDMNAQGIPNVPAEGTPVPPRATVDRKRSRNTHLYNGALYTEYDGGWRDFSGNQITDPVKIRHLNYIRDIDRGKQPSSSTDTHKQYILSPDRDNPIVVSVSADSNTVTEFSSEEALEYLDNLENEEREKARERAIDDAMKESFQPEEDIDLTAGEGTSFEEFLFGDKEDKSKESEDKKPEPHLPLPTTQDPNKPKKTTASDSPGGSHSVNEIMIDYMSDFIAVITEKISGGEWTDFPMDSYDDMVKYLEKKDIQTSNIDDVQAWLDMIKNCK